MITVTLLAVGVLSLFGITSLGLRRRSEGVSADRRGIALQTVIIMVVLLVIAGAVAGVLLTRGNEAVTDLENQDVSRDAEDFENEALCKAAGFSWSTSSSNNAVVASKCVDN